MKLDSQRVINKNFQGRIDTQLLKKSQEYRVLATLRYLFLDEFEKMYTSEAPDLQDNSNSTGIEVTIAVKEDDMKSASAFEKYTTAEIQKDKDKYLKKIIDAHANIHSIGDTGTVALHGGGGLNEETMYKVALLKKIGKVTNYKNAFDHVYLAVLFPEITSRQVEEYVYVWTRDVIKNMEYEIVFAISERFCFRIDLVQGSTECFQISKTEDIAIKKVARMTAEGELNLNSVEWQ